MANLALEISIEEAAARETLAIRNAPRRKGMTGQKARGKQKLLNRDAMREFDELFSESVVISREIIAA